MNKQIFYTFFLFSVLSQSAFSMQTDPMELDNNHHSKSGESIKIIGYKHNEQKELIKGKVTVSRDSTITLVAAFNGFNQVKIQTPFFNNINTETQIKCWTCYTDEKYPLNVNELFERKEYLKLRTEALLTLRSQRQLPMNSYGIKPNSQLF